MTEEKKLKRGVWSREIDSKPDGEFIKDEAQLKGIKERFIAAGWIVEESGDKIKLTKEVMTDIDPHDLDANLALTRKVIDECDQIYYDL